MTAWVRALSGVIHPRAPILLLGRATSFPKTFAVLNVPDLSKDTVSTPFALAGKKFLIGLVFLESVSVVKNTSACGLWRKLLDPWAALALGFAVGICSHGC